ncbi:hypothetical protein [Halovivax cerinus]|uniref:Zn-dependent protease n=1 Tax=Halovivax cerinus TaxID=1487865 RepID=A0ABD5NIT5_9EURY|nr:hypothetical protein [Halovivax cerinus]
MTIFPPTRRPTVDLVVFGDEPAEMVPIARRTLNDRFGIDPGVRRVESVDHYAEPVVCWDEPTYFPVEALLDPTTDASEADREIGLVAEPLVLDGTPGIFGVALVGDTASVITSDPLTGDDDRFDSRVEKQVTKQLGHLFGIEATHEGCVFAETSTVFGLDETPPTFCESCRDRLTNPATSPKSPDWFVRDTHAYREIAGGDAPTVSANETEERTAPTTDESAAIEVDESATPVTDEEMAAVIDDRTEVGASAPDRRQSATVDRRRSSAGQSVAPDSRLPDALRRPVHGIYRYARVWALILCFASFALLGLLVELELYVRLVGSEPSTAVIWGMLVGAAIIGYYGQRTARRWVRRGRSVLARS